MNKKLYLSMMAFALALAACSGKKEAVRTTGIKISNLDTTALPGTDFYQYAMWGLDESQSAESGICSFWNLRSVG